MNGTKQILIVEDDTKIAAALAVRLNAAGYQVLTAPDGVQGLQLALDHRPDLIVMDIWMPVGLGLSVAQRLQNLGLGHIPIIVMTASKLDGLQQAAQEVGAVAFFEKPYNADVLLNTIARTLKSDHVPSRHHSPKHPTQLAA